MLRQRALSALVLVPPLLLALAVGLPGITVVLAIAAALGAVEVFRLLKGAGYPSLPALGTVLAVAIVLGAAARPVAETGFLLLAIGAVLAAVGAFGRPDPRDGLVAWVATVFGALYVGMLGFVLHLASVAPAIPAAAVLEPLGAERGWVLLLLLAVWSYDTGAYFVGKQFGRARFLVHISPSKTYAGLVGGLVATTVVVMVMLWALGQPALVGLLLGPALGLAAQAGDLAESMLKRAAGAKDSGTLIPGHGGILDRVDSFLFAAPVLTLYVLAAVR
jgi:phosphatidate cytidylyltransferase